MAQPQGNQDLFYDLPFIYTYDADGLTNGQSYFNVTVPMINDSNFHLRRIAGRNLVCGQLMYRDAKAFQRLSAPSHLLNDHVVAPELVYPMGGSQISLDILGVNKASWVYAAGGSVPNYYSQLAFQGVRRFWGAVPPYVTTYRYFEKPYTFSTQFTIARAGRVAPAYQTINAPQRVTVAVDNYDFELQYITITVQKARENVPSLANAGMKLTVYAPGEVAMSSAPVVDLFLNGHVGSYNNSFPAPYVVYPASGQIIVDVTSLLLDTEVPATVWIDMAGVWRFPC